MTTLLVRGDRVMLPDGERPATIRVQDGRITGIGEHGERVAGVPVLDAGALVILPGLVDSHVHINDPGRADWEGFEHATQSAAAGGITTLVDMPLNSIPATTTVEGLRAKQRAAEGHLAVDVGFWGGVVPGNSSELDPLARAGVLGFKCFLTPSGVDEFENVTERDLREAMPVLARLGLPLLVHAEWPELLREPEAGADPRKYSTWLNTRPPASEGAAIDLMIRLAREFGTRVHIVHLASADSLMALAEARSSGVAITVETCPHYLAFSAEEIPDGSTAFKCAPPIREHEHRERLWQALESDAIDLIATDHSPAPPVMKHIDDGDFLRAWGGIASLQVSLSVVWTGAQARGMSMRHIPRWLAEGPARLAGLDRCKGMIAPGFDADLVFWDPDQITVVDAKALYHRHPVTPYDGVRLRGHVVTTILRGYLVFDEGKRLNGAFGRTL